MAQDSNRETGNAPVFSGRMWMKRLGAEFVSLHTLGPSNCWLDQVQKHLEIVESRSMADSGRFFDWEGKEVPW